MLIVFSLSVCLSVSLSISLYVYSVYDFYNNNWQPWLKTTNSYHTDSDAVMCRIEA